MILNQKISHLKFPKNQDFPGCGALVFWLTFWQKAQWGQQPFMRRSCRRTSAPCRPRRCCCRWLFYSVVVWAAAVQASVSSELSSAGFCTLTSSSLRWLWGEIFKHRRENNSIEVTLIYAVLSLFCALFKSWLGILDNAIATGNENRLKWWDTQKSKRSIDKKNDDQF